MDQTKFFKTLEIYGTGKYPHLLVEDDTCVTANGKLDFGTNIIGQSVTKYFTIINMTEVRPFFLNAKLRSD